jgi:hypothetical protein
MNPHRWLVIALLALGTATRVSAQATPYIPLGHPAYGDLDALVDAGLVSGALLGHRPLSRLTLARHVGTARLRIAEEPATVPARFLEALDRLEAELAAELGALCTVPQSCVPLGRGARARSAAVDATWATSPPRAIPTSYDFANSDYIDADLNPLLDRNLGRVLADGGTIGGEVVLDATLHRRLAAQAHPRVWALDDSGVGSDAAFTLLEGYARALLGNVAVEVGRNHVAVGHSREAGPVLSHNARGLDLVRLSLDRPARLPWKLRALGTVGLSALAADMGGGHDTPHSKLFVFDGILRPHRLVELSMVLLNHQAGENAPPATFMQRVQDLFLIYPQGAFISDKVVGAGAALSLPSVHTRVYVDVMSTDDHDLFRAETGEALGSEAVWIGGARVTGIGADGRYDLWLEGRKAGVRPHTHHQFTSGLTLDRRLIGDALGPLARALAGGLDWRGPRDAVSAALAWERYAGADFYEQIPDDRYAWDRTRDRPDETRARITLEWRRDALPGALGFGARLGYERVTTFAFTPTRRANAIVQVRADYRW